MRELAFGGSLNSILRDPPHRSRRKREDERAFHDRAGSPTAFPKKTFEVPRLLASATTGSAEAPIFQDPCDSIIISGAVTRGSNFFFFCSPH